MAASGIVGYGDVLAWHSLVPFCTGTAPLSRGLVQYYTAWAMRSKVKYRKG